MRNPPRGAVLSVAPRGIADLLALHGIREGLGLNIAVMHELSLGAASPWCAGAASSRAATQSHRTRQAYMHACAIP